MTKRSREKVYTKVLVLFISIEVLLSSCIQHDKKTPGLSSTKSADTSAAKVMDTLDKSNIDLQKSIADTSIEVLNEKDIFFNDKLKRYFSLSEFHSMLGRPDSIKLLSDEEPCTNIFQEADGSTDPQARYLFKNGSRFENLGDKVAIDEIKFSDGDFIVFRNRKLNKHTTLDDLKDLFPNAVKKIKAIEVPGEGKLPAIQLREDSHNTSDGHINIFIRKGKLYALQWWFPC